jgi:hypothetical protein
MVHVLQALPMGAELCKTVLVDIVNDAGSTSCDLPTLLHTLQLTPAVGLRLAHHVVIIVVFAASANEEGRAEERRRGSSEFLDLGDVLRQRSGVNEELLVESGPD